MTKRPRTFRFTQDDRDAEVADRRTASLAGLAITLLVLVIGLWLTHELQKKSHIEDCLMAGRINCDILVSKAR